MTLGLLSPSLAAAKPFEWDLPSFFPRPKVPADNPMTWEKVELGRLLFYDTRMSGNQTFSCASCHAQELAFTDGRGQAIGSLGEAGGLHLRGSMSLANIAYSPVLTWGNPLILSLEQQALTPMFGSDPIVELGLADRNQLFDRLRVDPRYQRMFAEAFPEQADPFTLDAVVKSIASFQRTLISSNSPFDKYFSGEDDLAMSASALRGFDLFATDQRQGGLLECHHCHNNNGINFASVETHEGKQFDDIGFANNGLYALEGSLCNASNPNTGRVEPGGYPLGNRGIYEFIPAPPIQNCLHMGQFKAPTLRNITVTAPYMHDGSIATLEEVIDHYASAGRAKNNPYKSGFLAGFQITAREKQDLLAFLESFTDEEFLTNPKFADPFQPPLCTGDCNYDGVVSVDELITNVGIEMEEETLASCLNGDADGNGTVDVAEMIQAVNGALKGCPEPSE